MTNKEIYRAFTEKHEVPLYLNAWWFDAVCGEKWEAIVSPGKSPTLFAFPYKKKYGLRLISMPMLTLGLGAVNGRGLTELDADLVGQLPPFDMLDLFLLPGVDVAQDKTYKVQTRNTYRIAQLDDMEKVFASFASSTRQQIRKAQKQVSVEESDHAELLYKMVSLTFKRQGKKTPYSLPFVKSIIHNCISRGQGKILVARGADGQPHGACFVAWDKSTAYYVLGGSDPAYKSSAGYSLLMWEAIQLASRHAKIFDFCGSNIKSIAKFFEGFNGKSTPYQHIRNVNSQALKLILKVTQK